MPQAKIVSEQELKRALAVVAARRFAERDRLALLMTHWAGMRVCEVAALTRDRVLGSDGSVLDEVLLAPDGTKGSKGRVVYICPAPLKLSHYCGSEGGAFGMARKRHSDEDCLKILRQVELDLAGGADVAKACRSAGISDATYYTWRKKFGGMARSQLSELKALEKENQRLKKIVADLELDKLILKESLDFLKPKI